MNLSQILIHGGVAAALSLSAALPALAQDGPVKLLTAAFADRSVVQVEAGDFHFVPGQIAPVHTHEAPAIGYVAKGTIIYQAEGSAPQILREGDAFYEPAGPRILRFDNASATEEAIFIDFNFQQAGEPFIVFETPPTEPIDRRALPTLDVPGQEISLVDVYVTGLHAGEVAELDVPDTRIGYVAEGVVNVRAGNAAPERVIAGASFHLPAGNPVVTLENGSDEVPAKVVSFTMR